MVLPDSEAEKLRCRRFGAVSSYPPEPEETVLVLSPPLGSEPWLDCDAFRCSSFDSPAAAAGVSSVVLGGEDMV